MVLTATPQNPYQIASNNKRFDNIRFLFSTTLGPVTVNIDSFENGEVTINWNMQTALTLKEWESLKSIIDRKISTELAFPEPKRSRRPSNTRGRVELPESAVDNGIDADDN